MGKGVPRLMVAHMRFPPVLDCCLDDGGVGQGALADDLALVSAVGLGKNYAESMGINRRQRCDILAYTTFV